MLLSLLVEVVVVAGEDAEVSVEAGELGSLFENRHSAICKYECNLWSLRF
jgi:hypothetical protein